MNLTSLDSNVILRLILNDVPEQSARAGQYVNRSACYITDSVVAECVFVLEKVYKLDRDLVKNLMAIVFELNTVAFSETLIEKTFKHYVASRKLSFIDCYSIVEAIQNSNDVVTFDQAILKKFAPTAKEPT
jgi:uncharacterized protein